MLRKRPGLGPPLWKPWPKMTRVMMMMATPKGNGKRTKTRKRTVQRRETMTCQMESRVPKELPRTRLALEPPLASLRELFGALPAVAFLKGWGGRRRTLG